MNKQIVVSIIIALAIALTSVYATTFVIIASSPPGIKPVHRFYNQRLGSHFYTLDDTERQWLVDEWSHVMIYEGVVFYAWDGDPNDN